ncbi:MAG: T9SS type A sorting domain-containing protein, partial [Bacteroidota bacterium]
RLNFGVHCRWSTWDLGRYDSNAVYNPHRAEIVNFEYRPDDVNPSAFTWRLQEWQSFSSQDAASDTADFSWPPTQDYSMFLTNESSQAQSFQLSALWSDFEGDLFRDSIVLAPWTGKILWMVPDCDSVIGGLAFVDSCGICAGGNTGVNPILEPNLCGTNILLPHFPDLQFDVFPNPTNTNTTISFDLPYESPSSLDLLHLDGRFCQNIWTGISSNAQISFSTQHLAAGLYILRLRSRAGPTPFTHQLKLLVH